MLRLGWGEPSHLPPAAGAPPLVGVTPRLRCDADGRLLSFRVKGRQGRLLEKLLRDGNPGLQPKFQLFSTSTTPATGPPYQISGTLDSAVLHRVLVIRYQFCYPEATNAKTAERFRLGDRTSTTATTTQIEHTHHARHVRQLTTSSHTGVLSCSRIGAHLHSYQHWRHLFGQLSSSSFALRAREQVSKDGGQRATIS